MRVAVAGGTGLVGRQVAGALRAHGHEPVVISRAGGIDLVRGNGLRERLEGVSTVIDVTNTPAFQPDETEAFFGAVSRNLLAVGRAAGVQHHVVLSILGLERVAGNGHYAGKRLQEQLARHADIPAQTTARGAVLRLPRHGRALDPARGPSSRPPIAHPAPRRRRPRSGPRRGRDRGTGLRDQGSRRSRATRPRRHGPPNLVRARTERHPRPQLAGSVPGRDGRRGPATRPRHPTHPNDLRAVARCPDTGTRCIRNCGV